jgi:hypothetical protein
VQTRTTPPDEPDATGDGGIVETEVETVRTRQHVAGAVVDAIPASQAVVSERSVGYFETLPERLSAVGLVVLTAIDGLLGMRFLLRALGANTSSNFVGFIDAVSWLFVRPFANVFSNRSSGPGVIEVSTLVAMGVYFLIFALLGRLVTALAPRLSGGTEGRGVTTPWASTPLSTPAPLPAGDERHRRPRLMAAMADMHRHRRLVRLARARKS